MSDLIVTFLPCEDVNGLVPFLGQIYGNECPAGRSASFHWGSLAVLEDAIAKGRNWITTDKLHVAWVGDLVFDCDEAQFRKALQSLGAINTADETIEGYMPALKRSGLLDHLSGSFALLIASENSLVVITDPMGGVQVYLGTNRAGKAVAIGTQPDLTACATGEPYSIDPVSVCDFISMGTPCFPHTMHRNVTELSPGTAHVFWMKPSREPVHLEHQYWVPPAELHGTIDEGQLEEEFARRWRKAVSSRCNGNKLGVQLSGGLDSRIVLAAIPTDKACVALTLCDTINREARYARRVARCYHREWIPLRRDPEYLGRTALQCIRFTGCEGEWHHGHSIGFAHEIAGMGIDSVFTGLLMDNNFKGYYAQDLLRVPRLGGLLPATHKVVPLDYAAHISSFCRTNMTEECVEGTHGRRVEFCRHHFARERSSPFEWLDGYPYSQAGDNTGWVVERRVMPLRLPVMDRPLLELAFQVPIQLKADGRFFQRAAIRILGPGKSIPNANDGVRPASNHVSRLLQRAGRKTGRIARNLLPKLGIELQVPHSWHDFERYWRQSVVLDEFRGRHGDNLEQFTGKVFKGDPREFLKKANTSWQIGSRLIQLAVWQSVINQHQACFRNTDTGLVLR